MKSNVISRERGVVAATAATGTVSRPGTDGSVTQAIMPLMTRWRRLRGLLLRIVLRKTAAVVTGGALAAPAVLLLVRDFPWESGLTDALALVMCATGAALVWTGLTGRQPDWVDDELS